MSSNNLPAGAEHDPRAPWNAQDYCRYCDIDQIVNRAIELVEDPDDDTAVDAVSESLLNEAGLCHSCKEEETADFRGDD